MIKISGHINPDTDTICSPIAYAWYLNNILDIEAKPVSTGDINNETKFILEYLKVDVPELNSKFEKGDKVILMDTNNPEELTKGIEDAEIIEIIDHHKLFGGLKTESPISVTMKPVGCTATIVWEMIKDSADEMPSEIAGLLFACIISDTLKFASPTTTEIDKKAAKELQEIAELDIDDFAEKMFEAKSDLGDASGEDIIMMDSKKITVNGKDVRVSVLETTKPELTLDKQSEVELAIEKTIKSEGLDALFFFVVDIISNGSKAFVINDHQKEILEKAFKGKADSKMIMDLPGIVSRKKQIIPKLEEVYNS